MSSIGEPSLASVSEESNRPAFSESPKQSPIEYNKFMAEHSGKDILSSDVEIKGSIKFKKELLIDGKVEGEIHSEGVLTIGENADIRGEIKTKSIVVFGKVQGNITVNERCELKSKCSLQGDLKAARLVIEEGATFVGKSEVTSGMSVKPSTGSSSSSAASRAEVSRSTNDEGSTATSTKPAFARA
jgi:cytoskeletal protein CcmA (bactofilin family)